MKPVKKLTGTSGPWAELYEVESSSRPGLSYIVGKTDAGAWGCSCPAWVYRSPRRHCKHITQVLASLAGGAALPIKVAEGKLAEKLSRFALVEA